MIDHTKTDPILGIKVNEYLLKKKVQTPIVKNTLFNYNSDKIETISTHMNGIMTLLDLDLNNDSLKDTPKRVAKMYMNELFWGLRTSTFPKCTVVENSMNYDEMVLEKNIKVMSDCEHHWRPIVGVAHVAYIPNKRILGLSKLNRIVEYFCRRPQIQERLTEQIYYALEYILGTKDIAVVIDAEHFCVKQRGVEDINSSTITSKLGGKFMKTSELRHEFMILVNKE